MKWSSGRRLGRFFGRFKTQQTKDPVREEGGNNVSNAPHQNSTPKFSANDERSMGALISPEPAHPHEPLAQGSSSHHLDAVAQTPLAQSTLESPLPKAENTSAVSSPTADESASSSALDHSGAAASYQVPLPASTTKNSPPKHQHAIANPSLRLHQTPLDGPTEHQNGPSNLHQLPYESSLEGPPPKLQSATSPLFLSSQHQAGLPADPQPAMAVQLSYPEDITKLDSDSKPGDDTGEQEKAVTDVQTVGAAQPSSSEAGPLLQSKTKLNERTLSQEKQPTTDHTLIPSHGPTTSSGNHDVVPQIMIRTATIPVSEQSLGVSAQDGEPRAPEGDTRRSRPRQRALSRTSSRASSPASSQSDASSDNGEILPTEVPCTLQITLDDSKIIGPPVQKIKWYRKSAFGVLSKAAEDCLIADRGLEDIPLELKSFYLRNGSCRIKGREHVTEDCKLEHDEEIVEVLVIAICGFIHDHPYEPFGVLVNWDYSTLCIKEMPGKPYREVIRKEIYRKVKKNFLGKWYISRTDLIGIISPETSRRIIDQDEDLLPEDKATLLARVRFKAEKLQAACVYAPLPMSMLQHILDAGFDDNNRPSDRAQCPRVDDGKWDANFGDLLEKQATFFAYKFPAPKEGIDYDDILPNIIVPIQFASADGKVLEDEKVRGDDKILGEGSFSIVYRVKVDPVHHYFSENKNQLFALKEFKERKKKNAESETFKRELEMLKKLKGFPHPHIVTHLFTWTQNEKFYMLFPMARFNLREYMRIQPADPPLTNSPTASFICIPRDPEVRRPTLRPAFVIWLLKQLKGLGDAVDHIHQLGGEAVKVPMLDARDRSSALARAVGYHHDIKPDNILVFIDGEDGYGTLKIGDFGSGRVQTLRSGTQQRSIFASTSLGTTTYEGPDVYMTDKATRAYDLWSLGCVFLEILLWCFIPGKGGAEHFATDRYDVPRGQANVSSDGFWYPLKSETGKRKAALKPAVVQRLQTLREDHCKDRRAFTQLLDLIDKMFTVEPGFRIKATDVASSLRAILKQAEDDIKIKPECYMNADFDDLPESAVPIPNTPTTVPSRQPSLRDLTTMFGESMLSPKHAESPTLYRRRSESFGQKGMASATSNTGLHLSQSDAMQDDGLPDPLTGDASTPTAQNYVRGWEGGDDPFVSQKPQPPPQP